MGLVRTIVKTLMRNAGIPAVETLEVRRCLSAIAPGWSASAGGCTLTCVAGDPNLNSNPCLIVNGTAGDDVMSVGTDPADASKIEFSLNGATLDIDRADIPADWLFGAKMDLQMSGGGGNDRIADNLSAGEFANVWLDGGDGNDTLMGGGGSVTVLGDDGLLRKFTTIDRLTGGSGDDLLVGRGQTQFIEGGSGDDTIFAANATQEIWTDAGNDVVHGPAGPSSMIFGQVWVMKSENGEDVSGSDQLLLGNCFLVPFGQPAPGPGDRQIGADDPGALAGSDIAALVGDVLVIRGTAGSDTAHLWASADGATLNVSLNGIVKTFSSAAVAKYAFAGAGGNDTLIVHDGAGVPSGWALRTANPDDSIVVQHTQDPGPSDAAPAPALPPAAADQGTQQPPATPLSPAPVDSSKKTRTAKIKTPKVAKPPKVKPAKAHLVIKAVKAPKAPKAKEAAVKKAVTKAVTRK